jgi:hypothetical protein
MRSSIVVHLTGAQSPLQKGIPMRTKVWTPGLETIGCAMALWGAVACSSSTSPNYGGAPPPAEEDAGGGGATLTVMNFLSWCSVSVNGGAASTAATVTASVPTGAVATIAIMPASSAFEIGADPWFGVAENDGGAAAGTDMGSGTTETSTATVFVSGNQCVSVCCELPNNSPTPCPTTNPCP